MHSRWEQIGKSEYQDRKIEKHMWIACKAIRFGKNQENRGNQDTIKQQDTYSNNWYFDRALFNKLFAHNYSMDNIGNIAN